MRYSGSLTKKERAEIFKLFLDKTKLRFNEIEKKLKIRSNMVAYHLKQMEKENIIEKRDDYYYISKSAEKYIPLFTHITGEEIGALPVILVAVVKGNKILLIKRNRRPYKDYWSMIGGKINLGESFKDSTSRQVKEKTFVDVEYASFNAVLYERVYGDNMFKHSFIIFFTKVNALETKFRETEHGMLKWFDIDKVDKLKIIPSDLWLIKNRLSGKLGVKEAIIDEEEGKLVSFRILK